MPNYLNSKVYRISTPHTDKVYIGSTTQEIEERKGGHARAYKLWKNEKHHYVTAFTLFELGVDDVEIELLENFPCLNRDELLVRERYHIENNNSINKIIPGRTQKEYKEANKEYIKGKSLEYYNEHKNTIIEKAKEYRTNHRETIREKNNIKKICSCGGRFTVANKSAHMRSKKHFLSNFIQEQLIELWEETSVSEYESDSNTETSTDDSDSNETVYMFSDYEN